MKRFRCYHLIFGWLVARHINIWQLSIGSSNPGPDK